MKNLRVPQSMKKSPFLCLNWGFCSMMFSSKNSPDYRLAFLKAPGCCLSCTAVSSKQLCHRCRHSWRHIRLSALKYMIRWWTLFLSDGDWTGRICLRSDAFRVTLAAAAAAVCFHTRQRASLAASELAPGARELPDLYVSPANGQTAFFWQVDPLQNLRTKQPRFHMRVKNIRGVFSE